ncbi:MAG: F0F1 ATP synthase subunit epsilon [Propionibacteriaceae bacterium]|jgi:F-type H+-transporting ATPase subunit epsilon|nr:F0F1 ATP synthase subunit epsilon [Propionibacteriaceae bacterium]
MAESFPVDVVAADREVWIGRATQVIATTTEGEIGILAGHIPTIATLAPGSAEITTEDGGREVIAVDGGFLSVSATQVAIISPYAQLAQELSLPAAEKALRDAAAKREEGDNSLDTQRQFNRALAQVKAARKRG